MREAEKPTTNLLVNQVQVEEKVFEKMTGTIDVDVEVIHDKVLNQNPFTVLAEQSAQPYDPMGQFPT